MGLKDKWAILCASLLSRADLRSQGIGIYQHKKGFDSLSKGSPVVGRAHEDDGAGAGLAEEMKRKWILREMCEAKGKRIDETMEGKQE